MKTNTQLIAIQISNVISALNSFMSNADLPHEVRILMSQAREKACQAQTEMGNNVSLCAALKREALDQDGYPDCLQCREIGTGMGPSHDGSKSCESGSIASGGKYSHCTCDVCF